MPGQRARSKTKDASPWRSVARLEPVKAPEPGAKATSLRNSYDAWNAWMLCELKFRVQGRLLCLCTVKHVATKALCKTSVRKV